MYQQQKPTGAYAPLSPWAYFGLQILFSVPVVGFIFLIVFSFSGGNINRRNFARSYWCVYVIIAAIALIALIVILALGGFSALAAFLADTFSKMK